MLINCVAYQDGRKLADIPIDDIDEWVRKPGCFVWVAAGGLGGDLRGVHRAAGIWGMNFDHMPELKWAYGYPMALAAISCAAGMLFGRFRRSGWL